LQMMYCDLIFKNCFNKIDKRLDQLRRSMSDKMEPQIDDRKINAIDHLAQELLTLEKQLTGDDDLPFVLGSADIEAMKQTRAKSLYEALRLHAYSVKEESKSSLNARSFASLSAHCWVLGKSQLLKSLASAGHINNKLMLALSKFGEYFRGVRRLHKVIEMPSAVTLFQNIELIPVTPEPVRKVYLDSNFLYVLEVIYYSCTGLCLPVRREQIIKNYGPAIKNYRDFTKSYVRHAEVSLVDHIESLKPNKLAPTNIGISKLCCRLCAIYIDTINSQKLLKKWQVSGSHGSIYLWQRDPVPRPKFAAAENAVKEYVYTELVNIINSLLDSVSESPTAPGRGVDEFEEVGSTAFELV
jgi:OTT_1508-like deaminase